MAYRTQLKAEAMRGYEAAATSRSPFLSTSDSDSAWHIGAWLKRTGQAAPCDVRPSRGHTYHVNGRKVRISWTLGNTAIELIG